MLFDLTIAFLRTKNCEYLSGVRQKHTADLQVNEVNLVVKCSNRFPIPTLKSLFRDGESVRAFHSNVYLVYLPVCSLQSAFVAHRYLSSLRNQSSRLGEMRGGCIHFIKNIDTRIHYVRMCCLRRIN